QADRPLGADDSLQPFELALEDLLVQEQKRAERLVLSGGADAPLGREAREEAGDRTLIQIGRVALPVEQDESASPENVRLLRARTQMPRAGRQSNAVEEPDSAPGCRRTALLGRFPRDDVHRNTPWGRSLEDAWPQLYAVWPAPARLSGCVPRRE